MPDIDIDFADRNDVLSELMHVPASIIKNGEIKQHNTGVYFQDIPVDPITNLASLDYEVAEKLEYFKIDFLNVNIYKDIKDSDHLDRLCEIEPDWHKLQDRNFVDELFHLKGNFDIVSRLKPHNIEQLAIVLAIKIPCKRYLINQTFEVIKKEIWQPVSTGEFFMKRAHAFGYSQLVMVQMNLLTQDQNK